MPKCLLRLNFFANQYRKIPVIVAGKPRILGINASSAGGQDIGPRLGSTLNAKVVTDCSVGIG